MRYLRQLAVESEEGNQLEFHIADDAEHILVAKSQHRPDAFWFVTGPG
jgi:hypothetical protein